MEKIDKQSVLDRTHYGIDIYAHILRKYYPGKTVLSLWGRTCNPARNPFNTDEPTLLVVIVDNEARHADTDNAIAEGNAIDFAELHYKLRDMELLQKLNSDLHLHIGEKRDFYANRINEKQSPKEPVAQVPPSLPEARPEVRYFSFFKSPIKNTVPHKSATLLQIYNAITGEYYKERTEKFRSISDPNNARQFKANNFDYCTFSGVFTSRNDKNLVQHSGLLVVDFDHLISVETIYKRLLQDEYFDTQLLFRSPSGDGLKWVIQISPPLGTCLPSAGFGGLSHSEFFTAVANYILHTYDIEVDKSGRDISRACFLPYDPNAFINPLHKLSTELV